MRCEAGRHGPPADFDQLRGKFYMVYGPEGFTMGPVRPK